MSLIECRQVDDEREAQAVAIEWHGGQWSALYMVACGNLRKMSLEDLHRAGREIYLDILDCESTERRRRLLMLQHAVATQIIRGK